jgi:oligopeptide transport system permease protein
MAALWRRLRRDRAGLAGLVTLAVIALICFGSSFVTPHPYDAVYPDYVQAPASWRPHPNEADLAAGLSALATRAQMSVTLAPDHKSLIFADQAPVDPRVTRYLDRSDLFAPVGPPTLAGDGRQLRLPVRLIKQTFLFGTDANGRDLLTRILVAGRISLAVGALASLVALGIGVVYGAVAGYAGGRIDGVMMRLVDIMYALPFIFLVIVLLVYFGRSLWLLFLAIAAVEWLDMARIVRGQTLALKQRDFVAAAKALGAPDAAILRHHILPNMSGPIVAYLALLVPRVILAESFLSFLGLGVQEPLTSWGILIADGARHVPSAVHLLIFPAAALALTLVAANQLGEALLRAAEVDRA